MTPKVSFHGSDIEKICSCYHLKKENLVNFAANVNPLGLSLRMRRESVKFSVSMGKILL